MKLNTKGQALLLVIAAMTVALALGINVSMRTLQSVSRTSRSDTAERVLAAAEGGLERALNLSPSVLEGGINNSSDCALLGTNASIVNGECVVSFETAGDPIIAKATVVASDFTYNAANNTYKFRVEQDTVTEVKIAGASAMQICWSPVTKADLYAIVYGNSGIITKIGLRALGSDTPSSPYNPHNFTNASASGTKRYCSITYPVSAGSIGLRIRSIGGDAKVEVISDTLPAQGTKITSTGYLSTDITSKKAISVYKSYPYLPGIFDYSIMSVDAPLLY